MRNLGSSVSIKENLQLKKQEAAYEKLRMCSQTKCRVNAVEPVKEEEKVLQLLTSQSNLKGKQYRLECKNNIK